MKVILHLDLDSYFVSAQRTIQPELIGKPVVITDGLKRSIITASSYEAKKRGVKVPMPFYEAKKILPNLIAIKPNFALYTVLSTKLFELLSNKITQKIQVASIDECYLDVTDIYQKWETPFKMAKYIQKIVMQELKLPISIGISNNKFVAKMSTQINKPFGITITKPGDFKEKFGKWPTNKIHGVGGPTNDKLKSIGIENIEQLINADESKVIDLLGVVGKELIKNVNEKGSDTIDSSMNDLKGIGNSMTFMDKDRYKRKEILEIISHLSNMVAIRMNNRNLSGSVISVSIKGINNTGKSVVRKQETLIRPIKTFDEIFKEATYLFDEIWDGKGVKFASVRMTKLENIFNNSYQTSIFDIKNEKTKTSKIIDVLNSKLGEKTLISLEEAEKTFNKKQHQSRFVENDRIVKRYKDLKKYK
ncbi:MAG: DNA polymerase IV [Mycoplasmatales bacterium]|nr:DNA polymerase IV [Mycoplasmatales bacterium]